MRIAAAGRLLVIVVFAASSPVAAQDAQNRLWDAAIAGDTAAIRRALADGAAIDSLDTRTNPNGRRALNWAAWHNQAAAVQVLVSRGASIDAVNRTGFTALSHAAEAGSWDAARALLVAGADVKIANRDGLRPLEIARAHTHDGVVALLEAAERGERPKAPDRE